MNELGVDAEFLEWPIAEGLRKISFNLVHLPYLFAIRNYDVVFICAGLPLVFVAKYLLGWKKPKFVIYNTFLTNALKRNIGGLSGFITRKAIEGLDVIVCTGKEQETFLLEKGFAKEKIVFTPIGIDAKRFADESTKHSPLNLNEGSYILAVGRDPGRDYKTLFEAVKDLPVKVKVATKQEVVAGLEVPKNVELLLHVPYSKMPALYQGALCAVVPLRDWNDPKGSDTSGQYGYLEPMASGKAVIASDKTVVRDYIENGVDGLLVPGGNAVALREAIQKLISDEGLRARLGQAAQKKVLEKFTSKKFATALADIFKKLL
jgi:glycosyltransferase involved in cell wall biosynthesis